MKNRTLYFLVTFALAAVTVFIAVAGHAGRREFWLTPPTSETEDFMVPPPPFTEGIFPCSECHSGMTPNPKRRELKEEHTDIQLKNHAENERWCLDCHDMKNRDKLRLEGVKNTVRGSVSRRPYEERTACRIGKRAGIASSGSRAGKR